FELATDVTYASLGTNRVGFGSEPKGSSLAIFPVGHAVGTGRFRLTHITPSPTMPLSVSSSSAAAAAIAPSDTAIATDPAGIRVVRPARLNALLPHAAVPVVAAADPAAETPIFRSAVPSLALGKDDASASATVDAGRDDGPRPLVNSFPAATTIHELFELGLATGDPAAPCLGHRPRLAQAAAGDPPAWARAYTWMTRGEVAARRTHFSRGLATVMRDRLGVDLYASAESVFHLALYAANRPEWLLAELAAHLHAVPTVALYDTLGADATEFILNHAEVQCVVASLDKLPRLLDVAPRCPRLKVVVIMDGPNDPAAAERADAADPFVVLRAWAAEKGLAVVSFAEVEALGRAAVAAVDTPLPPFRLPKPDSIICLSYTSGTTGTPKGVMLTHRNFLSVIRALFEMGQTPVPGDMHISYLPLAHVFERLVCLAWLGFGVSIGFSRGNVKYLMEDVAMLRPTVFTSVPRLLNRVADAIQARAAASPPVSAALFRAALTAKKEALRRTGALTHSFWDALVFKKVRAALGGRVRVIVSGSAPLSDATKTFLRVAFSCQVIEGYGMTETAGGGTIAFFNDFDYGHVGAVAPCTEMKLVSIPEMGYLSTDKPDPRGEIWFRGENIFVGYFKEPEKTAEALTEDGWLRTGDVGRLDARGRLAIIDRKKNLFKLSQGEYVAPEKLEGDYVKSRLVAQIYVHGDASQNELVAVVVPDPEAAVPAALAAGAVPAGTPTAPLPAPGEHSPAAEAALRALSESSAFRALLLAELGRVASVARLSGIERVRAVRVIAEPFAPENGLLTPTMKLRRADAARTFRPLIDEMYRELAESRAPPTSHL
ncbi:Long chain acyl-CoA synthetase 7 peroxisomal, partial [Cladochytrium tenue]